MGRDLEIRPLTVPDLWVILAEKKSSVPRPAYQELLREVATGRVMGGFVDGVPVGMGAVQTFTADGPRIAWLDVVDGLAVSPRSLLRAVGRYIDGVGADRVTALVAADQPKHQRFVRLSGFRRTDRVVVGMEIWRHERADRQDGETAIQPRG